MSDAEAFEVAIAYLKKIDVSYFRCYHKDSVCNVEMHAGCLKGSEVPLGRRRKVWQFSFEHEDIPPDTIVSKNTFHVDVDDDTGACNYFG